MAILTIMVTIVFVVLPVSSAGAIEIDRTEYYTDTLSFELLPGNELGHVIQEQVQDLDPALGIEVWFEIPTGNDPRSPERKLEIYNVLRKISTMEGIRYYSASRGEMRVFYHESYSVPGVRNRKRLADPLVDAIPESDTVYAYQRDGSFGRNVQEVRYQASADTFLMQMTNQTTMFYHLIPLVGERNLQVYLLIDLLESGINVYGHLAVRVPTVMGLQERAQSSFYHRIEAMASWFEEQLKQTSLVLE